MPLLSKRAGKPVSFLPSDLSNLAAWFRFNSGITSSGGAVSQWNDASGNARHLFQATGAAQPALQGDGSILFDGTSDFLRCDPFTLNQPATYYLLVKQVTWGSGQGLLDGNAALANLIYMSGASPAVELYAGSAGVANNTGLAVGVYGVIAAVFNTASSLLQINNGTATTGNPGINPASGLTIGARGGSDANYSNIQVKEVVVYAAAHDSTTRAQVTAYLQTL